VHKDNVLETCQKCHEDATQVFAESYSHVSQNLEAQEVEGVVSTIYFWLIVVIIGGMILHNILIYVFEVRKRKQKERTEVVIPRFTKNEVIQHVLLFTSFFALAITGFALKYPRSWWADGLYQLGMTEDLRQLFHRISAVIMISVGIYHIIYLFVTKRGRDVLTHLIPKFDDIKEAVQNLLYYLHIKKKPPEFDKFDYTEKAEYWALVWGTIVMGITGLILWFPTIVGDWAPVWLIKVSETIHFYEAILATLAIFVWHWFFVIFRPSEYPMSFVWVDGKMSLHRYRHHHEKHFKKIALEWMQIKEGQKTRNEVSHSTKLFLETMEKHGADPDEVMSAEMETDPDLRSWVIENLKGLK
jgi:cytochrome b subunit of formate dehydrogenase